MIDRPEVHHHTKTLKAPSRSAGAYFWRKRMQRVQPKYTAAQWEQVSPAFRGLAISTVDMAKSVLVDGVRPADLARQLDVSRQLIYAAVQRVRKIMDEHQVQELVPVMVWLPPELAEQVKQMAAPYEQPKGKKE